MTNRSERGATATESLLIVSVVGIGVVSAGYAFVETFETGVANMGLDVARILRSGEIGGVAGTYAPGSPFGAQSKPDCQSDKLGNTWCDAQNRGDGASPDVERGLILSMAARDCGQNAIAFATGEAVNAIVAKTKRKGYTNKQVMATTGLDRVKDVGIMSLGNIGRYLRDEAGLSARHSTGNDAADAIRAAERGQVVIVTIDVDDGTSNATGNCAAGPGECGHHVVVTGSVTRDGQEYVQYRDKSGVHEAPASEFSAAMAAHGGGMVTSEKSGGTRVASRP